MLRSLNIYTPFYVYLHNFKVNLYTEFIKINKNFKNN